MIAALVIPLLGLSYFSQRSLNGDRERLNLTTNEPLANAPPALAFTTVALGGFRGIIANALWMRASDLQEEEKFFELIQLADWITKLQPRFAAVWSFQAWNLAYNVSVKFPDHASRWKWVREGLSLLRDQGLRYNPGSADLHYRLAYMFQHKLADDQDSAHNLYKAAWKQEMESLLGGATPNWEELLRPITPAARDRARRLRTEYKLDPVEMKRIDEHYGPLEWRLPESHAIYWADYGLENTHSSRPIDLRRVIYQSLQTAVRRGRMIDYPESGGFELVPDHTKITAADRAYREMIRQDTSLKKNIGEAHKNFLLFAITLLDGSDLEAEAHRWFKYMVELYPSSMDEYEDYSDLIRKRVVDEALRGGPDKIRGVLRAFVTRHFSFLAAEQGDLANLMLEKAAHVHKAYHERYRQADDERIRIPTLKQLYDDILRERIHNPPPLGYPDHIAAKLCALLSLPYPAQARSASAPDPILPPGTTYQTGTPKETAAAGQAFLAQNRKAPGIEITSSGVQWQIAKRGTGASPQPGSMVRAHLVGSLWNGTIVESTRESETAGPMDFKLSVRPPGIQEAMRHMKEGGKRTVYLPPELAYGKTGALPNIPANAVVIYEIELVKVF